MRAMSRFRFSLRALLLGIFALSAWAACVCQEARAQREVVRLFERKGALVFYAHQEANLPRYLRPVRELSDWAARLASAPSWLRRSVGEDYFQTATVVVLRFGDYTDADFDTIGKLRHLRLLLVTNTCTRLSLSGLARVHQSHPDCQIDPPVDDYLHMPDSPSVY